MKNQKKDPKKMNRADIDPSMKAKYGKELTMIEDELEKMYQVFIIVIVNNIIIITIDIILITTK